MESQERSSSHKKRRITRREFMGKSAAAAAGFMIVPRHVLGGPGCPPPSDTLNIGCVGVGGQGSYDIRSVSTENIVALCDVDDEMIAEFLKSEQNVPEKHPMYDKPLKYRDFRIMLEKEKSIDAVTVTTPDHTHAVIAMMAIDMGKHVFCQKPLTHTIKEARLPNPEARRRAIFPMPQNSRRSCSWETLPFACRNTMQSSNGMERRWRSRIFPKPMNSCTRNTGQDGLSE